MSTTPSLHFSSVFAISCGTVSIDLQKSLVLVIRYRKTGEHLLPKGRKDINETLEQAALRETFEETGYPVELLPLPIPTLATVPTTAEMKAVKEEDSGSNGRAALVTEPIAVTQRVVGDGVLKIIFWFAARVDSTLSQREDTQQEGEDFESVWVSMNKVAGLLDFDDDRQVAARVVAAVWGL